MWSPMVGMLVDAVAAATPMGDFAFLRLTLALACVSLLLLVAAPIGYAVNTRKAKDIEFEEDRRKWTE